MMIYKDLRLLSLIPVLFAAGCGSPQDFNGGKVAAIIQGAPIRLDAEYVVLNEQQVTCGVQNDLWDPPAQGGGRSTAHLTDKGRDLKFSDDVSIGDLRFPYVQVRGDFTLVPVEVQSDREGPEQGSKLVDVRLAVPITHSCFPQPLPMMGVKKGSFTQDYPPVMLFKFNNGWYLDKIVH